MNILITGATGFLGSRLVEHLAPKAEFTNILATGRKFSHDNKVNSPKVTYSLGDLTDQAFVKSLFENKIDAVVNCASLASPWGAYQLFYEANIKTQKYLLAESKQAAVQRFVYISSPSIYFDFKDRIGIKDDNPFPKKMVNTYAQTKLDAERLLENSGLTYVTMRPRALVGRGDTVIMPRLIRSYEEGRLKIMGSGNNIVDLTSVSNVVEAIRLAILTDDANCNTSYNISNGEPVNLWDAVNQVLTAIGKKSMVKKLPYPLLMTVARLMETKAKLIPNSKEPVLTKYSVGVLAKSFTFNIDKAKKQLNYKPTQTTEEAIEEFATWYKNKNND